MQIQDVTYAINYSEEPVDGQKLYNQLSNFLEVSPNVPYMAKIPCKFYYQPLTMYIHVESD